MGRALFVGTDGIGANAYTPLDLFHYSANGVRDFSGTTAGYASPDGGNTDLGNYNTNPNGDFGDWASSAGHDSFLAFSPSGALDSVSQGDLRTMNIIGYNEAPPADTTPPALVADVSLPVGIGKTATISASNLAFNDPDNTDAQLTYTVATGPADGTLLKSGLVTTSFTQADIDNGLITYAENGSNVSSDSFSFTVSDPAGNHTVAEAFQFQVLPVTVIEAFGSTSLTEVGNQFDLYNGAGAGPVLKLSDAPVLAGQFGGGWAPIGAEQTANGYEVAWKVAGADEYTVWNVDSNGNYLGNAFGYVSGSSPALESLEPSFHQDLNGDGIIGVPSTTVIDSFGSTYLTEVSNQFYLFNSSGSGPVLKLGGSPVLAGQFGGGWAPIGAEQTANGYEIAWKVTGADQYTVWNVDSSGNYVGNAFGYVSGSSPALEALEPSFHQDLNGDGTIGIPGTVIESFGSTYLTELNNEFYLNNSSGSGPVLKLNSTPVVDGQFGGGWAPIGAEQSAGGYVVAWKVAGADEYTVWNVDSSGNYESNVFGYVSGSSSQLEAEEPIFQQDLNGDGVIGISGTSAAEYDGPATFGTSSDTLQLGGSSGGVPSVLTPQTPGVVGAGNFLGDGNTELLWLDGDNAPTIAQMAGTSVVGTVSLPAAPIGWQLAATGDFNGDGKSDILWLGSGNTPTIWEFNGSNVTETSLVAPPSSSSFVGVADVNGNGKSNLLWQNSDGTETAWEISGTQVTATQVTTGTGAGGAGGNGSSTSALPGDIEDYLPVTVANTEIASLASPVGSPGREVFGGS